MTELVTELWKVADRLYQRLGTQSARALDVDACDVICRAAEALETSPKRDSQTQEKLDG